MRNKSYIPLIAVLVIFLLASCWNPTRDNPCDPLNPDYQKPFATIISGPKNGDTLSLSEVLFTWEGNNVDCPCSYSYKLAYASKFDAVTWSDWTYKTSIVFKDLDEDLYIFAVRAQYPTGDAQKIPTTRQFTVNAYRETSLLIKPCVTMVHLNQQFTLEITAEEVQNLMAARINLNFSQDTIEIAQNGIQEGEFLTRNGGQVILLDSVLNSQGKMEVDLGIAEGTSPGVSGSGTLAVITFKAKKRGLASISFDSSDLRDTNNHTIQISGSRGGKVRIE
jgi:hypothetical protein